MWDERSGGEDARHRLAAAEENGLSQGRTPGDFKVRSGSMNGLPTEGGSTGRSMGTSRGSKSSSNQFSGLVWATTSSEYLLSNALTRKDTLSDVAHAIHLTCKHYGFRRSQLIHH